MRMRIRTYLPIPPFQDSAGLPKRKINSSVSPDPEVKRKNRAATQTRKTKKNSKSRVPHLEFIYQPKDEPEEDDILIAHRSTHTGDQAAIKKEDLEVDPPLTQEPKGEMEATASHEVSHIPKKVADLIEIMETPS